LPQLFERLRRQILERALRETPKALAPDDVLERPMDRLGRAVRSEHIACLRNQIEIQIE
jgi:hypothetical protein